MMWDFWSHSPEALHQVTILFSDRGIPDGYRHMHGFGSHTYSLINAKGERHWVKWHYKTRQGIKNLAPPRQPAWQVPIRTTPSVICSAPLIAVTSRNGASASRS